MVKYRLLNKGEKIKEGDEYYYPIGEGEWKEISKDDLKEIIDDWDYPHRRKMKDKKKWRLLELGEIIKKGINLKGMVNGIRLINFNMDILFMLILYRTEEG